MSDDDKVVCMQTRSVGWQRRMSAAGTPALTCVYVHIDCPGISRRGSTLSNGQALRAAGNLLLVSWSSRRGWGAFAATVVPLDIPRAMNRSRPCTCACLTSNGEEAGCWLDSRAGCRQARRSTSGQPRTVTPFLDRPHYRKKLGNFTPPQSPTMNPYLPKPKGGAERLWGAPVDARHFMGTRRRQSIFNGPYLSTWRPMVRVSHASRSSR